MATLNLNNLKNVGKIIREKRKSQGLTQSDLGRQIGVSTATIQKYEKGAIKNIPLSNLLAILDKLQILDCFGITTGPADIEQLKVLDGLPMIIEKLFMDFKFKPHSGIFNNRYLVVDLADFPREDIEKITNTVSGITNKLIADGLTKKLGDNK